MIVVGVFYLFDIAAVMINTPRNLHTKRVYPDILVIDVQQLELPSNDQGLMNQILISNN